MLEIICTILSCGIFLDVTVDSMCLNSIGICIKC